MEFVAIYVSTNLSMFQGKERTEKTKKLKKTGIPIR